MLYLKPDGAVFDRQTGILKTARGQKDFMKRALDKAPPIPIAQKPKELSPTEKAAAEVSARNELRAAMSKLNVGRKKEAVTGLKQVVAKYPRHRSRRAGGGEAEGTWGGIESQRLSEPGPGTLRGIASNAAILIIRPPRRFF